MTQEISVYSSNAPSTSSGDIMPAIPRVHCLVTVSRHQDPVSAPAARGDGCQEPAGTAVNQQIGGVRLVFFRDVIHQLPDHPLRLVQIVQPRHLCHIQFVGVFHLKFMITFMPRHMHGQYIFLTVFCQGFIKSLFHLYAAFHFPVAPSNMLYNLLFFLNVPLL